MDKTDITNLRRRFVNAPKRRKLAGFDLICLYGAHGFGIFQSFLSRATNQRSDEYLEALNTARAWPVRFWQICGMLSARPWP